MKKIEVKTEVINIKYEACDGTIFPTEENCINYESSVKATLLGKLKKCEINRGTEYELFNTGSDEYEIRVYLMQTNNDLDTLNTLYHYCHPNTSDNFVESIGDIIMIDQYKFGDDVISFVKVTDFVSSLLGNKFKVAFYQEESKHQVFDVNELEYAD